MEIQQKKSKLKRRGGLLEDDEADKMFVLNPIYEEQKQENAVRQSARLKDKQEKKRHQDKYDGVFKRVGEPKDASWTDFKQQAPPLEESLFTTTDLVGAQKRLVYKNLQIYPEEHQIQQVELQKPEFETFQGLEYVNDANVNYMFGYVSLQMQPVQKSDKKRFMIEMMEKLQQRLMPDGQIENQDAAVATDYLYRVIAMMIVLSSQYSDQQVSNDFQMTNEQFKWLCQSSTESSWDAILGYKLDLKADLENVLIEATHIQQQHLSFFKQMFYYLFQDTTLTAERYMQITADKNNLNPPSEYLKSPEFVQYYRQEHAWEYFFQVQNENKTTFTIYEDIAKRMNVSKLYLVTIYHYIFQLINTQLKFEFVDELKDILRYWFMPRSLKDVSLNRTLEENRNQIKPVMAGIVHHLLFISMYSNEYRQLLFRDKFADDLTQFRRALSHLNIRTRDIEGLQVFLQRHDIPAQDIKANINPDERVDYSTIQIRSDASKVLQGLDIFRTAGIHDREHRYENVGDEIRVNRQFDYDAIGNHALFTILIYELYMRQQLLMLNTPVHFVNVILSGYYGDYNLSSDELRERHYMTIHFVIKDLQSLEKINEENKDKYKEYIQQQVQQQFQHLFIRMIAEQLDYYDTGMAPPIDVQRLDFATLAIEKYSIYTLNEASDFKHNVIGYDQEKKRFAYFSGKDSEGEFKIIAYFKGGIIHDQDYKESILPEYQDDDNFTCVFNVASYIWGYVNQLDHNLETKQKFLLSQDFKKLRGEILIHNVNAVYLYYKQKGQKIVLFFPESFLLYQTELISDAIWIYVKLGHAWIGKKEPCFSRLAIYKQEEMNNKYVYCVPFHDKNKGSMTRREYVFYDIETIANVGQKDKMQPILLCFQTKGTFNEKQSIYGVDCCDKFIAYLDQLNERLTEHYQQVKENKKMKREIKFKIFVYAHNGGRFDHLFLQKPIYFKHSQDYNFLGTATNLKYASYLNIVFRDSVALIPGKLSDLCKEFKVNQKTDFDAGHITMEKLQNEEYKNKLIEYCENDVICLQELFFKFINTLQSKIQGFTPHDIKQTLPSTALHIFQKFFLKDTKIYGNINQHEGNLIQHYERLSYFGGHTQVFRHGVQKQVRFYDFVSMYVSIMSLNEYPISQGELSWAIDEEPQNRVLYIIKSFKFSDQTKITNLPVRNRKNNVSIYPLQYECGEVGNEYLSFWGEELILAKKLGLESVKMVKKVTYKEWGQIFKLYMDTFFEMKKNAEDSIAKIAKLFGNSLYGKWGQNCEGKRKLINTTELRLIGLNNMVDVVNRKGVRDKLQKQQKFQETVITNVTDLSDGISEVIFESEQAVYNQPGSLVRLASYTTMKGRCQIIEVINNIGYDNIFYCDTDSVVFRDAPGVEMGVQIGKERGQIADQFPGLKILEADFIAAKCYYVKLNGKYKGNEEYVRFKGVQKSNSDQVKQLRNIGKVEVPHEYWRRQWNGVGIYNTTKKIVLGTKRYVEKDGRTRPFLNYNEYNLYVNKNLIYINNEFIYQ